MARSPEGQETGMHTFISQNRSRDPVRDTPGQRVSKWTKREADDEAASTEARAKCTTQCARTADKPRRCPSNRTLPDPSTAEIATQSAGREDSRAQRLECTNLFRELPLAAAGAELSFFRI